MTEVAVRIESVSESCDAEILMNDAPVLTTRRAVPLSASSPVNAWLANGRNRLALRVRPLAAGLGAVSATVAVHMPGRFDETRRDLFTLKIDLAADDPLEGNTPPGPGPGFRAGPVTSQPFDGGILVHREFELDARFPEWRWLGSERLTDSPELRASLMEQYQSIWNALSEGQLGGFPALLRERTDEYRLATFSDADTVPDDYGLSAAIRDGRLFDLQPEDGVFRLFGDGRLVEFQRWDGKPMITFVEGATGRYFQFIFRRERGAWIVTR